MDCDRDFRVSPDAEGAEGAEHGGDGHIRHILHGSANGKPQIGLMRQFYKHPKDQKACCNFTTNWAQKNVDYIASYPMILAVRKHDGPSRDYLVAERHGTQWIPYGDADHL